MSRAAYLHRMADRQISPYTYAGIIVCAAALVVALIGVNGLSGKEDTTYALTSLLLLALIPAALGVALVGLGRLIRD